MPAVPSLHERAMTTRVDSRMTFYTKLATVTTSTTKKTTTLIKSISLDYLLIYSFSFLKPRNKVLPGSKSRAASMFLSVFLNVVQVSWSVRQSLVTEL